MTRAFDIDYVRQQFPALTAHPRRESPGHWAFFDNAGGSLMPQRVIDAATHYMSTAQMQFGAPYPASVDAARRVRAGREAMAQLMDCDADEVVINGSTTLNIYLLADALAQTYKPGDVVIISDADHEANRTPWLRLQSRGIEVRRWPLDPETLQLRFEDLEPLLDDKVRLVAYTQCANVVGAIHDVGTLNAKIKARGPEVCVDAVAYAPHRRPLPKAWNCDYYLWSAYKVYGPHLGVMYAPKDKLLALPNRNHIFLREDDIPYKLQPGNINHELGASLVGTLEYLQDLAKRQGLQGPESLDAIFEQIATYEAQLSEPLLAFLNEHPKVQLRGPASADPALRVPTIAFTVDGQPSEAVAKALIEQELALKFGNFYAKEAIRAMGLDVQDGVVRVSLVHYNHADEVQRLIAALKAFL